MKRFALLVAVLVAGCDGTTSSLECAVLGGSQVTGLRVAPMLVTLDVKFLAVEDNFLETIGVDIRGLSSPLQSDSGGSLGGLSAQGRDVVADSSVIGGSSGVPYLVPNAFDGFSSIVNTNFVSPFFGEDFKVFLTLPFVNDCVTIAEDAADDIDNFAGGANLGLLSPNDPGFRGSALSSILNDLDLNQLLQEVGGDSNSEILSAPRVTVFENQRAIVALQDLQPAVNELNAEFNNRVTSVVSNPFNIFTGVVLDVVPFVVNGNEIQFDVRFGTQLVSFQRSVQANVNNQGVDIEIPAIAPGTVVTSVTVPDGGTVVIGGLMEDGASEETKGIPILGDLPILGQLFRQKTSDNQSLVILITATIVDTSPGE